MDDKLKHDETTLSEQEIVLLAFGCNEHDLNCNREGYLSKSQQETLRQRRRQALITTYGLAGLLLALILLAMLVGWIARWPEYSRLEHGLFALMALVFGGMLGGVVLFGFNRWQSFQRDLEEGKVHQAEGAIKLKVEQQSTRGPLRYRLTVGYITFDVPEGVVLQLRDGDLLRVYYTPDSRIALCAEPFTL